MRLEDCSGKRIPSVQHRKMPSRFQCDTWKDIWAICVLPTLFLAPSLFGLIRTSGLYLHSGIGYVTRSPLLSGEPTIDPTYGFTYEALGVRAAKDLFSGRLPLWNPYEGFGAPLLGEMQAAALFPPSWLQILPHGQVLEFAVLQLLAGLGAFLFLCKVGVDRQAALAGGLLFQLNGVFAWLRCAPSNPVAFLPWLFLVIEALYILTARNEPFKRRFRWLVLGGAASALAVYAGYPEEVYLYAFLLLLWAGLRFFGLKATTRWIYLADLGLVSFLGLLLSLPALVAFVGFLPEAALGAHGDNGFYGVFLPPATVLQYLLPYIYGTIFSVADTDLQSIWGSTGGYIGVMPVILAAVALQLPARRALKVTLAFWIVVAVGVSHGAPGIYQAFMHLPLMNIAATYRYLNISWIFCFVILVGLCLDELARTEWRTNRRALLVGIGCGCTVIAIGAAFAWPVLTRAFSEFGHVRNFVAFSVLVLVCILAALLAVVRVGNTKIIVSTLATLTVFEAGLYFSIPYLSYPRRGKIDFGLAEFLKSGAGFQRIVAIDGGLFSPNYGSYFGISQLNWNDIPVPRQAVQYVQQRLDPYGIVWGVLYLPESPFLTGEQSKERRALFLQRLDDYARAGVKYVLSNDDPGAYPAIAVGSDWRHPVPIEAGQRVEIVLHPRRKRDDIAGLSVLIGTYGGKSNGRLRAELCRADDCESGTIDLASVLDNSPAAVRFDHALAVQPGDKLHIVLDKIDGDQAVALWTGPLGAGRADVRIYGGPPLVRPAWAPVLQFLGANKSRLVYRGRNTNVFELPGVRPYFDSAECKMTPATRDEIRAECPRAGRLVRLELAMPGWRAFVGKQEVGVRKVDDIFQEIDLPEGVSTVHFVYAPTGVRSAVWISIGALLAIFAGLAWFSFASRNGRRHSWRMTPFVASYIGRAGYFEIRR
jgi:hypothetical protein